MPPCSAAPQGGQDNLGRPGVVLGKPRVIDELTLTVRPGEKIGLVGRSGAGKSTLVNLLLRFHDIDGGRILIDGQDIAQDMDAIIAAATAANAHEFISELPNRYDTVVGELGVKLSGGQRQRLAIARALLKDAPILLLDEATSALDNESERLVQSALDTLMRNRTTLVIAHRLSTIRRADRIVVLVRGQVVEQGTHEQLLALNAEYRKLHDLQFSDTDNLEPKVLH